MILSPLLVAILGGVAAPRPVPADTTRALTAAQAIDVRRIGDLRFSPDGTRLAFVVTEAPGDSTTQRHVWTLDIASGRLSQLTRSPKGEDSPRWAPDGRTLAFLSDRDSTRRIYLLPVDGGEARPLTNGRTAVSRFEWAPDGRRIAFVAPDPKSAAQRKRAKERDDAIVVDRDDRHGRLRIVGVSANAATAPGRAVGSAADGPAAADTSGTPADSASGRPLTPSEIEVGSIAWLPDGRSLVVSATDRPASDDHTNRIFAVDAATGAMRELAAPTGPFGVLEVSPDGRYVAYVGARGGPVPHDLYVLRLAGGPATDGSAGAAARDLTGDALDRPIYSFEWAGPDRLLASAQDGFQHRLYAIGTDGSVHPEPAAQSNPGSIALASNGTVAYVGEDATSAPEIWLRAGKGPARKVTDLNAGWSDVALVRPEIIRYHSFDGTPVEASLLRPRDAPAGPLPLIVLVHGGPTGAFTDRMDAWGQLLAAHGFAVLCANIRGSTGYGERFIESNRADWGGDDFKDIMAGVDTLVARGIADPDRLGIGGWSYGGYMAEWAITQTNRFKAAVTGAGMANLISEFGMENGPAYDRWFFGLPYENAKEFLDSSPFMYLKNAKTPTLILQGLEDTTDPPGQSRELYRGLKFYGVPAELVEYPREPHGFRERRHLIDRSERIVAWFEKYVK